MKELPTSNKRANEYENNSLKKGKREITINTLLEILSDSDDDQKIIEISQVRLPPAKPVA